MVYACDMHMHRHMHVHIYRYRHIYIYIYICPTAAGPAWRRLARAASTMHGSTSARTQRAAS